MQSLFKKLLYISSSLVLLGLMLLPLSSSANHRMALKVIDYVYGSGAILRIHAGNKTLVRFKEIPPGIDLVQVAKTASLAPLGMKFFGKRNQDVALSSGGKYVEFGLHTDHDTDKLAQLKLKLFSMKNDGSYEVIEEALIPVYSMYCGNGNPVCAMAKIQCKKYEANCIEEERRTFNSMCEMNKVQAEFLHDGECTTNEVNAFKI